jgi:Putative quorum-sensing-regulated virulence factor
MTYTMPFGRYRGHRLDELDDSYLAWLYTLDGLRQPLRGRVREEFFRRKRSDAAAGNGRPPEHTTELIEAGFKVLARKHHPDVGGSEDAMCKSLEARAWLIRHVTEAQQQSE